MKTELKYRIIKSEKQYNQYCQILEELVFSKDKRNEDEIELLTMLIEKWDEDQYQSPEIDPIQLIKSLMDEHKLKAKDLVDILGLSKGTISKILNYQTGLSKETIRKLSNWFKLSQEAFNRPYKLKSPINKKLRNVALMNTEKKIQQFV
jgi:HTH-type transcriptional regulator/antitoxin HigA